MNLIDTSHIHGGIVGRWFKWSQTNLQLVTPTWSGTHVAWHRIYKISLSGIQPLRSLWEISHQLTNDVIENLIGLDDLESWGKLIISSGWLKTLPLFSVDVAKIVSEFKLFIYEEISSEWYFKASASFHHFWYIFFFFLTLCKGTLIYYSNEPRALFRLIASLV